MPRILPIGMLWRPTAASALASGLAVRQQLAVLRIDEMEQAAGETGHRFVARMGTGRRLAVLKITLDVQARGRTAEKIRLTHCGGTISGPPGRAFDLDQFGAAEVAGYCVGVQSDSRRPVVGSTMCGRPQAGQCTSSKRRAVPVGVAPSSRMPWISRPVVGHLYM